MNDGITKNLPRSFYVNKSVNKENSCFSLPEMNQNKFKNKTSFSLLKKKVFIINNKGQVIKNVNRSVTKGYIYYNSQSKNFSNFPVKKNYQWENEKLKALYKNNSEPMSLPMSISLLRNNINISIK